MRVPSVESQTALFVCATLALLAVLAYISGSSSTVSDTLPAGLTDREFWQMIVDSSEPDGYFRSDNFLSNETGYQSVIPVLRRTLRPGGVYLGVGPEQNFTYVAALEPKIAFIVDVRRQNMIEHLIYKALMEMSHDREEFLSRLFSRPKPVVLNSDSTAEALVRAFERVQASPNLFSSNVSSVLDRLEKSHGFQLSVGDESTLRYVYRAFFESGPELSYTFFGGGYSGFMGMPTYAQLITENDGHSRNWNFLANERQFQVVQRLQKSNLIVPLVGDFAGPKAIRSVGQFLQKHNAVVSVFYTSNVEQYLFQDEDKWKHFYANASTLPVDSSSTFIRYVLNSWGFARRSRTLLSPIKETVKAYNSGQIRTYYNVVEMSQ
jgi:hypothetical protein